MIRIGGCFSSFPPCRFQGQSEQVKKRAGSTKAHACTPFQRSIEKQPFHTRKKRESETYPCASSVITKACEYRCQHDRPVPLRRKWCDSERGIKHVARGTFTLNWLCRPGRGHAGNAQKSGSIQSCHDRTLTGSSAHIDLRAPAAPARKYDSPC